MKCLAKFPRLGLVTLLSLLLLLLAVLSCLPAVGTATVNLGDDGRSSSELRFTLPESIEVLTQDTFDAYVFGKRDRPQSWLIVVFAPWCEHCRGLMPQFINASVLLEHEIKSPHARFGTVNAQLNPKLVDRFHVSAYPTLLYTTGRGQDWHVFRGGHSADSFVEFAVYLQRAVEAGSFADDVTDLRRFAAVEAESAGFRVPFYVYVPSESASTRDNQRQSDWTIAVDGAASIGNVRFGVLYERDLPATWREEADSTYIKVVETARRCKAEGKASGPDGEVLVSLSDRFRLAQCYSGEWLTAGGETVMSGRSTFQEPRRLNPLLERYITVNGFRAVEELNGGMLSVLEKQEVNYLGLIVVDGGLEQGDTTMLPAIRDMVQAANARLEGLSTVGVLTAPQVTWAYIDGTLYEQWRSRYDIEETEMPAFLLVDTVRNRLFRTRTRLRAFEAIKKDLPWVVDGPQRKLLEGFVEDVFADKFWGEKVNIIGFLAERLSYPPVLSWVYRSLHHDDFTFIVILFAFFIFSFFMVIAIVVEPAMERSLEREKRLTGPESIKKTQ